MRGLGTVLFVGFVSAILFGLIGPAILEPVVEVVVSDPAVQNGPVDGVGIADQLLTVLLVWAPLFVLGASVVSAVVWYFRRERTGRRVRR
jgi:hypothetical protein